MRLLLLFIGATPKGPILCHSYLSGNHWNTLCVHPLERLSSGPHAKVTPAAALRSDKL